MSGDHESVLVVRDEGMSHSEDFYSSLEEGVVSELQSCRAAALDIC
jgi:hypothetical protein